MSGQLPTDPGALIGTALRRLFLAAAVIAVLLLLFGPFGVVLGVMAAALWFAWRGGLLPTTLPMSGWTLAGLALLVLVLLLSGGGLLLVLLVALGLLAMGLVGPARLRAAWIVLRSLWALLGWLLADPNRLRELRGLAEAMRDAAASAARACRDGGAARAPLASLGTGVAGLRVPVPKATPDSSVITVGKAKATIPTWRITMESVAPTGTDAVTGAVAAAENGMDAAAAKLDALAAGFGLVAEALDAAADALPPN